MTYIVSGARGVKLYSFTVTLRCASIWKMRQMSDRRLGDKTTGKVNWTTENSVQVWVSVIDLEILFIGPVGVSVG